MRSSTQAFEIAARAKLNLFLAVGPPQANGLHAVHSLIADLQLSDRVTFKQRPGAFALECDCGRIPERENLVWKAVMALTPNVADLAIHIRKIIPQQSGLGGGSADAAAALAGVARMCREHGSSISNEALAAAAARLGSDVPACMLRGLKQVSGTGDVVRALAGDAPPWGILLLRPAVGISTADAYRLFDAAGAGERSATIGGLERDIRLLADAYARHDLARACELFRNDFGGIIESSFEPVAQARRRLAVGGAAATLLCGSGSCVAGFFESVDAARQASRRLDPAADEWICVTGFAHAA